jgi:fructose-bisphosphate aldolase, class II
MPYNLGSCGYRLDEIHKSAKGKMVLAIHGTSGLSEADVHECIAKGVRKVNVNKGVLGDYLQHLRQSSHLPLTELMEQGVELVQQSMEKYMKICKSSGMAELLE